MLAGHAGNATTTITKRWRLLVSNKEIIKIYVILQLIDPDELRFRKTERPACILYSSSLPYLKKMVVQRANF